MSRASRSVAGRSIAARGHHSPVKRLAGHVRWNSQFDSDQPLHFSAGLENGNRWTLKVQPLIQRAPAGDGGSPPRVAPTSTRGAGPASDDERADNHRQQRGAQRQRPEQRYDRGDMHQMTARASTPPCSD